MKHNLLLGLMLLISFTGCARQGTTHTLQKGTKKVYVTEATIKVPEHETVHMSVEQQYKVVDETAEGYVLDMKAEDIRAFYQNMLKQAGLNITDNVRQTLDEMVRNFKVEYTEEATYTFLPDGWVKTIDCVITQKMSEQEPITMIYKVYVK